MTSPRLTNQHFLSMEYIDGEDLASLLKRIGYLSNEKALDIARQLAAGLAAAHEKGVLHRDLKPANIMIDGHGRVRITDFGLAVAIGEEAEAAEILGTPAYMAPEQFAGKGATTRSDIYAFGLVLYELYSGKRAFTAPTIAELRAQKESQTRAPRCGQGIIVEQVPIVKYSVVRGVCSDVALVVVIVVIAMKTVGVAELRVNWLMKIPVELCAERIELIPAAYLALDSRSRQNILLVEIAGELPGWLRCL